MSAKELGRARTQAGFAASNESRPSRTRVALGWLLGFAALSLLPANIASSAVSGAFEAGGSMAPGPLAHLDSTLSRLSAGHGIPITIGLAAVQAAAIWATAEGLAGLTTDPKFRSCAPPAFRSCLHASCQPVAPSREAERSNQEPAVALGSSASPGISHINEWRHHWRSATITSNGSSHASDP